MIKSYFQCFAYDNNTSYLRQTRRRRSRSFVQGFLKLHFCVLENSTDISITQTDGANETVSAGLRRKNFAMHAVSAGRGGAVYPTKSGSTTSGILWGSATNCGIVIGTGTTAVAPTDYSLATQISDGVTSGTMEHFTCAATNFTTAGSTASFDLERLFRNSSGGSITINEVGVYGVCSEANSSINFSDISYFCMIRDIVSPGFVVNNGEYARIVYTISVTA